VLNASYRIVAGVAVAAVVAITAPARASAQATVSGRITITERPGEQSTDLVNTVIYLVPKSGAAPRLTRADASIAMTDRTFIPRVRIVTPGSKVAFPNQDPFRHNIFSNTRGAVFDLGLYPSGQSRDATFRREGVYPIHCNIHPRMTSYIVVVGTPWYTMAGADGRWSIAGVPAGEYTMHVWHERAAEFDRALTVAGATVTADATIDARGFRFVQHQNKFGQEYDRSGRDRY
jgi:plastocyanin